MVVLNVLLASTLVTNLLKMAMLGATWVLYLLIILSIVSIGAMIERWRYFKKNTGDATVIADRLVEYLDRKDIAGAEAELGKDRSIEAQVVVKALRWAPGGPESFADSVQAEYAKRKQGIEKGLNFLGSLGSNAPFIGLFGTVIGVIEAFAHLGSGGGDAAMANVMGGIAEALVATGVGLAVAIPAVVAFNVFQKKMSVIEDNLEAITKSATALMKAVAVAPIAAHRNVREIPGDARSAAAS